MKAYWVRPGRKFRLKDYPPSDSGDYKTNDEGIAKAERDTLENLAKLDALQGLLYASRKRALLIILQALDTGGKDGTIKRVMSGVNPTGCLVTSFKVPTSLELDHDYLWRVHAAVPPKGYIGIFNRSHYEDVLVTRVHGLVSDKVAERRFEEINQFERYLVKNDTTILKFFLHISKDEQRQRLQERARDPKKHWKFNLGDLKERRLWAKYQRTYQDAIEATSTKHAPWYVVPANHKWYRNWVVSKLIVETLQDMKLKFPPPPPGINFKKIKVV